MKKIRVLEITHGLGSGGIETFVINIVKNLNKSKFDIDFCFSCDEKQYQEDIVIKEGCKIYRTNDLESTKKIIKHFFKLIRILKSEKFDVIHSHCNFLNGINLLAAFICGVPIRVSHSHTSNNNPCSSMTKMYRYIMKKLIHCFATNKIGCSLIANEYLYGNKDLGNTKVIYNGMDINKFIYINKHRDLFKYPMIKKGSINFITIGRMHESKNCLFIVKIMRELVALNPNIHLFWAGKGELEDRIVHMIEEYNLNEHITLLGVRNDIPELLSNMDFMIFPSKYEGLGIVCVEAQACGVHCFISDAIPKEANLGLCTIISLKKNEKEWANIIYNSIESKTYSKNFDEIKYGNYDIKKVTKAIENIYSEYNFI